MAPIKRVTVAESDQPESSNLQATCRRVKLRWQDEAFRVTSISVSIDPSRRPFKAAHPLPLLCIKPGTSLVGAQLDLLPQALA